MKEYFRIHEGKMILKVVFVRVKTERKALCLLKGKDRVGEWAL